MAKRSRRKLSKPRVIVVLGPTASGKSALAVKLALNFNGEVVSADSRQVYKGVDIGSDKITEKEMKGVRHHLLSVVPLQKTLSVVNYKRLAKKAIADILKRGRLPILCGGTGLYIDALVHDWKVPIVKPNLKLREQLEVMTTQVLYERLKELDLARAQNIDRYNKRRLVRALEIITLTGRPVGTLKKEEGVYRVLKIGLKMPKEELKKRIKSRTLKRLRSGLAEELEILKRFGIGEKKLSEVSLYYRWMELYLHGAASQEKTLELISTKIWQYAKRQMTWFKRDKNIHWILKTREAKGLVENFLKV